MSPGGTAGADAPADGAESSGKRAGLSVPCIEPSVGTAASNAFV